MEKTGTAETQPRDQGIYIISFIGCVPAKNPEIVIYVVINSPNLENQAQSKYATLLARDILEKVLPQLNIYPSED